MKKNVDITTTPQNQVLSINKWKFLVWLFILSIVMLFASQTSAYLVKRAEGEWNEFEIPKIFWVSTITLLISSFTMHRGVKVAKADQQSQVKTFIGITFILGIAFLIMQYLGWQSLQQQGIFMKGNPSGSFFYVFTGLHAVHILLGLGLLLGTLLMAIKGKINSRNPILAEVCATSWHFLDILWIYLFVFLLYFR